MAAPTTKVLRHRLRLIAKWQAAEEAQDEMENRVKEQQY
jgi:hypothetical protein